jgi:hypothetical protein
MDGVQGWRTVYGFWFPPGPNDADPATDGRMTSRWFGGEANAARRPSHHSAGGRQRPA